MQPINSRVVMISGAARGIGLAIARELAEHGFRLSLGARDIKMLEAHFGLQSDQVHYAHYDAYDPASAGSWVSSAVDRFGRIDALVNNAGLGEQVSLMDDNDEALDRLWAVNVKGPPDDALVHAASGSLLIRPHRQSRVDVRQAGSKFLRRIQHDEVRGDGPDPHDTSCSLGKGCARHCDMSELRSHRDEFLHE